MNRPLTGTVQAKPVTPQPPSSAGLGEDRPVRVHLRAPGQQAFGQVGRHDTSRGSSDRPSGECRRVGADWRVRSRRRLAFGRLLAEVAQQVPASA